MLNQNFFIYGLTNMFMLISRHPFDLVHSSQKNNKKTPLK